MLLAVAALVLIGEGFLYWSYQVLDRSTGPMLIAGRRGDIASWPEDTLEGVLSARDKGADAIEIDVRQTADGTFWLMHDATVDRTTNGTGEIKTMQDEDVAELLIDGGLGYASHDGLRVPRLESVFDALASYEGVLLVDAKGDAEEHAALAELILRRGLQEDAWIRCYVPDDTRATDSVATQLITWGSPSCEPDLEMRDAPLTPEALFDPPYVVAIAQFWDSSESEPMELARRWGVRMYITNDIGGAFTAMADWD